MEKFIDSYSKIASYHKIPDSINETINLNDNAPDEIETLRKYFLEHTVDIIVSSNSSDSTKNMIGVAKNYLDNNFKLHYVNTLSEENKKLLMKRERLFDNNFKDFIINKFWYECSVDKINPLDIPIIIESIDHLTGGKSKIVFPTFGEHTLTPYIDGIYINQFCSQIADTSYVHEIVNTQMEQNKNSYSNLFQLEVISYLMELIYSIDTCSKIKVRSEELSIIRSLLHSYNNLNNSLSDNIDFYSKYMALRLFANYNESNKDERIKMKYYIQKIWDGNLSVDNLFKKYNINFEIVNSNNLVRSLTI